MTQQQRVRAAHLNQVLLQGEKTQVRVAAAGHPAVRRQRAGEGAEAVVEQHGAAEALAQVAHHKAIFFRSGWASYETARPGTLRLMPEDARVRDLRADYRAMMPMMFDQTPLSFDDILAKIAALEETINS